MVIPRESDFRKNIDWLDNNFPREVGCGLFTVTSLFFGGASYFDMIIAPFLLINK